MKKTILNLFFISACLISKTSISQTWTGSSLGENIYRGGNVGIGTGTSPTSIKLNIAEPTNTAFQIDQTNTNPYSYAQVTNVSNDLTKAFAVQRINGGTATPVFFIYGNGVVNAKTIYAEAINVTPTAIGITWPDYVFKKGYKLMPLLDLEKFVQKNKHLPNVPSVEEVSKNGVNIYEINKALLEKVEELSLYVIELKKEMNAVKKQLQTTKK